MEIFEGVQVEELLLWGNVKYDFLARTEKVDGICEGSLAHTVPQHKTASRVLRHGSVFNPVIVPVALGTRFSCVGANGPFPNVVATDFHAVNSHFHILAFGEISLDSLVSTIRVADQYG